MWSTYYLIAAPLLSEEGIFILQKRIKSARGHQILNGFNDPCLPVRPYNVCDMHPPGHHTKTIDFEFGKNIGNSFRQGGIENNWTPPLFWKAKKWDFARRSIIFMFIIFLHYLRYVGTYAGLWDRFSFDYTHRCAITFRIRFRIIFLIRSKLVCPPVCFYRS